MLEALKLQFYLSIGRTSFRNFSTRFPSNNTTLSPFAVPAVDSPGAAPAGGSRSP